MRLTAIFLLVAFLHVSGSTFSQTVTLSLKNAPIQKVFREIIRQTHVSILYDEKLFVDASPVTIEVKNAPVDEVLRQCLGNQPVQFRMDQNTILIEKQSATPVIKSGGFSSSPPQVDIHGHVTDSLGNPLSGASVTIKGSKRGSTTDVNGNFSLTGLGENATLIISYTGYIHKEYKLNGNTSFEIILIRSTNPLDAVVIIPYGTTTARLNTGDISSVQAKEIEEQPLANPLAALEGRVPGLVVTQSTGLPGASFSVQIQGQSSLFQGSNPLFIIDGVPFAPNNTKMSQLSSALGLSDINSSGLSPFNSINPADIESIEVLKDADATAIYGSRGANGVILITTKKGKPGKLQFNASVYTGASTVTHMLDMLNTPQYLEMRHEAFRNDTLSNPLNHPHPTTSNAPDLLVWDTTRYTDINKLLVGGTASTTDAEASLSGGSNTTSFLFGAGYHRETTVFPGDLSDNRASLHLSLNQSSKDGKFNAAFTTIYSSDNNNLINLDISRYVNLPPDIPVLYDSTGKLNWSKGGISFVNPLGNLYQTYKAQTNNLLGNLILSYHILPELVVRTSFGYNTIQTDETSINPIIAQDPTSSPVGSSQFGNNAYKSWIIEPQAEYSWNKGKGRLNVLVGGTFQEQTNTSSVIYASGYTNDALIQSVAAAASLIANNYSSQYNYEGFFGRINYNWRDKYILNITGRRDGSSRFGPGKQFGNFGSVGAAWLFSNENLFKNNLSFLSFGKIRGSYGSSGNDQIGDYQYLDSWTNTVYPYDGTASLQPTRLYNPDYSWEVNKKLEGALDLGFLKDRIYLSAAYYRNLSNNQLISYKLPFQTGFNSIIRNFPASVQNTGLEFVLNTINIISKNFKWSSSFLLTVPKNKLISFQGLATSSYASTYVIGQPLSIVHSYKSLGVNDTTGVFIFSDKSGPTSKPGVAGNTVINYTDPQFYGGFKNSFSYKNWLLDIFFEFKKQSGQNFGYSYNTFVPGTMANQPDAVLARWQQPGDVTNVQKFTTFPYTSAYRTAAQYYVRSDAVFTDASYIRLKNISLSYNFPSAWLKKAGIENSRLFLLGQNLLTITHYKGNDPETRSYNTLPTLKTLTAGIQFTL